MMTMSTDTPVNTQTMAAGESPNRPKVTPRFQTITILKNEVTSICRSGTITEVTIHHLLA